MKFKLLIGCCVLVMSGCASTDSGSTNNIKSETLYKDFIANQELKSIEKADPFILADYMILDKQHVALTARNRKYFLAELSNAPCADLEFSERIGLLQLERDAVTAGDQIVRIGFEQQGCTIETLYKLNRVQYEELSNLNIKRRYNADINAPARF
ncbi:hypothetical protein KJY73_17035 [Bowmanella sp. Y26]|uniref:DUF6491 family protein n=1 Tax=Bowmanella yangjiangensis TaxID=2811230 RepID=UPI001BDC6D24|nr:DUF6491 family protein [Bowmanella yangjiangensis]MBT1065298.1 hypothetical protein [Bowmanella yangjiangensis]